MNLSLQTKGRHGYSVEFSPFFPTKLACASSQYYGIAGCGTLYVIETGPNGLIPQTVFDWNDGLFDITWAENNENILVTGAGDGHVVVWDINQRRGPIKAYKEHTKEVNSVHWSQTRQEHYFLSGSWDKSMKLWDISRSQSLTTFLGHEAIVYSVRWSPHIPGSFASASDVQDPRSRDVNGRPLPGPREISIAVHQRSTDRHAMDLSQFTMEFGQFVSHDIQFNALAKGYLNSNLECCSRLGLGRLHSNCLPISLPKDDPYFGTFKRTCMNFVRSLPSSGLDCNVGPRQQINQNTHYLDGSAVYGSDQNTMNSLRLRTDGEYSLLKSSSVDGEELLSKDTNNSASCRLPTNNNNVKCFNAGDRRVNQQPALISLQTIWHREHNRIAKKLKTVNPEWNDETLFQESRKVVGAMIQHITYHSYLQDILGNDIMNKFDLKPKSSGYFTGYNANFKAMIRNVFSTAAFRFGHSMINDKLSYHPTKAFSTNIMSDLRNIVLKPDWIYRKDGGVGAVTKGLYETNAQSVDMRKSYEVTRHLFESGQGTGIDLAAINIQRGRDHGLAPYNVWRSVCRLEPATTFTTGAGGLIDHPEDAVLALKSIYKSVDDIDLFTGGVSENPLPGARVGPLFACIIGLQFKALKYADRFYYENDVGNVKFTPEQLNEIRKTLMANVICRNTDISKIHRNVFEKKTVRYVD
uniref:Chorion peroxidase n=1 Tax=Magallana gigas TaxID=29159 RepID=K1QK19_MAGGI